MSNSIWGSTSSNPYPVTPMLDTTTQMPTRAWQQWFLNLLNFNSAPSATKGSATLPDNPQGFINVTVNGKAFKVPYYNQ